MGVHGKVRDRMEKFVVLPFSMGCVSQASVAVAQQRTKRKTDLQSPSLSMYDHISRFFIMLRLSGFDIVVFVIL